MFLGTDVFYDEGMRGFILNTARKEHWRVAALCDLNDLVQDGYVCYIKCRRRYVDPRKELTGTLDERKWFQALVRVTYCNHISSLAAKHKGIHECTASDLATDEGGGSIFERSLPEQPENSSFFAALAMAPWELQQLIKILAGDTFVALGFQRKKVGRRSVRETTNEYYCRLLGVDPAERDLVEEVRDYFH